MNLASLGVMWTDKSVVEFWLFNLWSLVRLPGREITVCMLMIPNKAETAVQWVRMSCVAFARFSGHSDSIYNILI